MSRQKELRKDNPFSSCGTLFSLYNMFSLKKNQWPSLPHGVSTFLGDRRQEKHPLVNLEDTGIYGGIFTEGDGHIDPSSVTNAFADRAKGGSLVDAAERNWTNGQLSMSRKWMDEIGWQSIEIIQYSRIFLTFRTAYSERGYGWYGGGASTMQQRFGSKLCCDLERLGGQHRAEDRGRRCGVQWV